MLLAKGSGHGLYEADLNKWCPVVAEVTGHVVCVCEHAMLHCALKFAIPHRVALVFGSEREESEVVGVV